MLHTKYLILHQAMYFVIVISAMNFVNTIMKKRQELPFPASYNPSFIPSIEFYFSVALSTVLS